MYIYILLRRNVYVFFPLESRLERYMPKKILVFPFPAKDMFRFQPFVSAFAVGLRNVIMKPFRLPATKGIRAPTCFQGILRLTVDGQNPAPPRMMIIPLFKGL